MWTRPGEGLALLPVASQAFLCSSLWRDRVLLALRGLSLPLVRGGGVTGLPAGEHALREGGVIPPTPSPAHCRRALLSVRFRGCWLGSRAGWALPSVPLSSAPGHTSPKCDAETLLNSVIIPVAPQDWHGRGRVPCVDTGERVLRAMLVFAGHYGAFLQEEWDLLQRMSELAVSCGWGVRLGRSC